MAENTEYVMWRCSFLARTFSLNVPTMQSCRPGDWGRKLRVQLVRIKAKSTFHFSTSRVLAPSPLGDFAQSGIFTLIYRGGIQFAIENDHFGKSLLFLAVTGPFRQCETACKLIKRKAKALHLPARTAKNSCDEKASQKHNGNC
jgi:hypothetical protein